MFRTLRADLRTNRSPTIRSAHSSPILNDALISMTRFSTFSSLLDIYNAPHVYIIKKSLNYHALAFIVHDRFDEESS